MKDLTAAQVLEKLVDHSDGVNIDGHTRVDGDRTAARYNLERIVNKAKIALAKLASLSRVKVVPRQPQPNDGWTVKFKFISEIEKAIEEIGNGEGECPTMEGIDSVIRALVGMGYINIEQEDGTHQPTEEQRGVTEILPCMMCAQSGSQCPTLSCHFYSKWKAMEDKLAEAVGHIESIKTRWMLMVTMVDKGFDIALANVESPGQETTRGE